MKQPRRIENQYTDNQDGSTTITVERRNGLKYPVIIDTHYLPAIDGLQLHVIRTRHGRNDFYARVHVDKKDILFTSLFF